MRKEGEEGRSNGTLATLRADEDIVHEKTVVESNLTPLQQRVVASRSRRKKEEGRAVQQGSQLRVNCR